MAEKIQTEEEHRASMRAEMDHMREEKGEKWYWYLNNFWCRLGHEGSPGGGYYRGLSKDRDTLGKTIREQIPLGHEAYEEEMRYHSELRKDQTDAEFYGVIDREIKKLGISEERIKTLLDAIRGGGGGAPTRERDAAIRELYELLLPAYVELRVLGYSHQELTS